MSTEVEICNSALAKVGAARILTLDDDSEEARLCKVLYPVIRDKRLRSHPWHFAKKRVELASSVDAPVWGYQFAYPLPSDCLRVLDIESNNIPWKEEDGSLLSDSSTMFILYIYRKTDTSKYDVSFAELLAYDLALELAWPLTQNASLKETLDKERKLVIQESRSFNAQVGSVERVEADEWLNARY